MLAYFIECSCPPGRRSATVGAGDIQSVEEFLADYSLTHIVCDACNSYFRLIGYIDNAGTERRVEPTSGDRPLAHRGGRARSGSRV